MMESSPACIRTMSVLLRIRRIGRSTVWKHDAGFQKASPLYLAFHSILDFPSISVSFCIVPMLCCCVIAGEDLKSLHLLPSVGTVSDKEEG
jgi:hypothetical protein